MRGWDKWGGIQDILRQPDLCLLPLIRDCGRKEGTWGLSSAPYGTGAYTPGLDSGLRFLVASCVPVKETEDLMGEIIHPIVGPG